MDPFNSYAVVQGATIRALYSFRIVTHVMVDLELFIHCLLLCLAIITNRLIYVPAFQGEMTSHEGAFVGSSDYALF